MKLAPSEIVIGERVRKDVDKRISDLCNSIRELGQLQPVAIDEDRNLIAGARRVRACELLEIDVDCFVVTTLDDALKFVKAERDENTCREPFTPSEMAAMAKSLEKVEKLQAAIRRNATLKQNQRMLQNPRVVKVFEEMSDTQNLRNGESKGETREKVADALGVSHETLRKTRAVVEAAAKPDAPPEVKQAKEDMDRTGKVDPAYKQVTRWEQGASQLPEVSSHSDADSESDNLFTLKRTWKKSSKKDRKLFLSWIKETQ